MIFGHFQVQIYGTSSRATNQPLAIVEKMLERERESERNQGIRFDELHIV